MKPPRVPRGLWFALALVAVLVAAYFWGAFWCWVHNCQAMAPAAPFPP